MSIFKNYKFYLKIICGFSLLNLCFFYGVKEVGKYDNIIDYGIIFDSVANNTKVNTDTQVSNNIIPKTDLTNSGVNITTSIQSEKDEKQKLDSTIVEANQVLLLNMHSVGDDFYKENFTPKVCKYYSKYCEFIIFDGNFSVQEKNNYLVMSIYLINKLNAFIGYDKLLNNIYSIRINKSGSERRGYSSHNTININLADIKTNKEFFEVLTHELGHIVDLGLVQGSQYRQLSSVFTEFGQPAFYTDDNSILFYSLSWLSEKTRKKGSSYKDFVSGYGMSDPFEDFAECFNLYLNHNSLLKAMAKNNYILEQKYNYLRNVLGDNYILTGKETLFKINQNPLWRVWDTTKIN